MTTLLTIALICLIILFLIGRKGLKEGRKAADRIDRIYDNEVKQRYYSSKKP